ncbi:MAG TPA: HWE histidine kinase domain-containing protein [Bradyrhizobium sp.]|nr:HWE histidine kinase domain-containing protein [Bradyrhizobium sp.]
MSEAAAHRQAIERVAPPSILVDESHRVLHMSEHAGRFLQPSGGPLSGNVVDLARPELRFELRSALHRVFETAQPWLSLPIPVRFNGHPHRVLIHVKPADDVSDENDARAVVLFIEGGIVEQTADGQPEPDAGSEIIVRLREELQQTQARLRTMREESESANEELRAANEELQSINEEYRSTSEELETSKEELQSINEELQTVNSELKLKLEAVSRAHSDLQNLMAATDFGTLFLDASLRIKRFTQQVTELFSITPADEGRPIADFAHRLEYDSLLADARKVLSNLAPIRHEIRSRDDRWYDVRLRPYRTVDDKIDGVVLTFVDMTDRKTMETQQRLLLRELTHRVKNTLTVVQSITHQTRRFSKTYEDFTDRLDGRIAALAAAHSLLVDSEWKGADMATLAHKQFEPHLGGKTDRVKITGKPVFLPADLATPFALVFHELATNATKHGAFSKRSGTVDLDWKIISRDGQPHLTVTWRERGGPKTTVPKTKGFGSELIERAIPNATVKREFGRDGVTCTIDVKLPEAT